MACKAAYKKTSKKPSSASEVWRTSNTNFEEGSSFSLPGGFDDIGYKFPKMGPYRIPKLKENDSVSWIVLRFLVIYELIISLNWLINTLESLSILYSAN